MEKENLPEGGGRDGCQAAVAQATHVARVAQACLDVERERGSGVGFVEGRHARFLVERQCLEAAPSVLLQSAYRQHRVVFLALANRKTSGLLSSHTDKFCTRIASL